MSRSSCRSPHLSVPPCIRHQTTQNTQSTTHTHTLKQRPHPLRTGGRPCRLSQAQDRQSGESLPYYLALTTALTQGSPWLSVPAPMFDYPCWKTASQHACVRMHSICRHTLPIPPPSTYHVQADEQEGADVAVRRPIRLCRLEYLLVEQPPAEGHPHGDHQERQEPPLKARPLLVWCWCGRHSSSSSSRKRGKGRRE